MRVLSFPLPNHLGTEGPLLLALMERTNVVNFPKWRIMRKSLTKYFSIHIYTWASLMFQEFIIQETKAKKKLVWFRRKWEALRLRHCAPLAASPGVGQRCRGSLPRGSSSFWGITSLFSQHRKPLVRWEQKFVSLFLSFCTGPNCTEIMPRQDMTKCCQYRFESRFAVSHLS